MFEFTTQLDSLSESHPRPTCVLAKKCPRIEPLNIRRWIVHHGTRDKNVEIHSTSNNNRVIPEFQLEWFPFNSWKSYFGHRSGLKDPKSLKIVDSTTQKKKKNWAKCWKKGKISFHVLITLTGNIADPGLRCVGMFGHVYRKRQNLISTLHVSYWISISSIMSSYRVVPMRRLPASSILFSSFLQWLRKRLVHTCWCKNVFRVHAQAVWKVVPQCNATYSWNRGTL